MWCSSLTWPCYMYTMLWLPELNKNKFWILIFFSVLVFAYCLHAYTLKPWTWLYRVTTLHVLTNGRAGLWAELSDWFTILLPTTCWASCRLKYDSLARVNVTATCHKYWLYAAIWLFHQTSPSRNISKVSVLRGWLSEWMNGLYFKTSW